ncbi:MAG: nucleoside triphosphate pyrophosphohydrolase [Patescibacteria group bacterium]|jgi:predicted house-cleaning noncanonical NTP pyrophosphatase (MazG superfamily)
MEPKLIRDHIPEIITANGERPIVRQVGGEELRGFCTKKVLEEYEEFCEKPSLEEAADLLEAVSALFRAHGLDE